MKGKTIGIVIGVGAAAAVGGFLAWRAYREKKIAQFSVRHLYTMPEDVEQWPSTSGVSQYEIAAVRKKYGDFKLHEIYVGTKGNKAHYLVEHYEGSDPLVFEVTYVGASMKETA